MKEQLSPTWILFASGNSVKVELSLYDPTAKRNRPIEAYMVSDVGSDLTRSASRAAEVIYAIAHTADIAPSPTVVGYDLQGLRGSHIAGQSSGLALALALAKKFWPDFDPGPIAATGEIIGSSNGGPLHKIAEIKSKAKTVSTLLPDGGYFFYPKDNEAEISETLKQAWQEKGIKAQAVTSVAEALAIFIPAIAQQTACKAETAASIKTPEKGNRLAIFLFILVALMMVVGTVGLLYVIYSHKPISQASPLAAQVSKKSLEPTTTTLPPAAKIDSPHVQKPKPTAVQVAAETGLNKIPPIINENNAITTAAPQDFPKIALTGTSGLADTLAQRTSSRLKAFLDSDRNLMEQLQSVNGRIEIIEIRERWDPQSDSLSSNVTTAFHGQTVLKNGQLHKINLKPVTVSGHGPMRQQLTHAATLIVDRIANTLQAIKHPITEKQSTPITPASNADKGFE